MAKKTCPSQMNVCNDQQTDRKYTLSHHQAWCASWNRQVTFRKQVFFEFRQKKIQLCDFKENKHFSLHNRIRPKKTCPFQQNVCNDQQTDRQDTLSHHQAWCASWNWQVTFRKQAFFEFRQKKINYAILRKISISLYIIG